MFGTAARELAEQRKDLPAPHHSHADYVWRHTDRWINFPWSTLPPVRARPGSPGH